MNAISKIKYPIAFEWPISEHDLDELKDNSGGRISSDTLTACVDPDIDYYVVIDSFGSGDEHHGEIWISLSFDFSGKTEIETNFNIKIESAKFSTLVNQVYKDGEEWGEMCCTTDQLFDPEGRFIVNGELRIKVDGFLLIEKEESNDAWECGKIDDSLGIGLWEQDESKDFTLEVDGKKITAHKNVLASRSPVFARMFQSGMKEAQKGKVDIQDFSFNIVDAAVKLCYHHSLVAGTSLDEKMELLKFFDKYDIKPHKENLENYLVTVVNELNVCRLVNASLISNAVKLEIKCYTFLQDCLQAQPVNDFDLLDKDFAMNLLKNAFSHSHA